MRERRMYTPFVRGTVSLIGELVEFMMVDGGVMETRPVMYNPYKFDTFRICG